MRETTSARPRVFQATCTLAVGSMILKPEAKRSSDCSNLPALPPFHRTPTSAAQSKTSTRLVQMRWKKVCSALRACPTWKERHEMQLVDS